MKLIDQFVALTRDGKEITIQEYQEQIHAGAAGPLPGHVSYETTEGGRVYFVARGIYAIVSPHGGVVLAFTPEYPEDARAA